MSKTVTNQPFRAFDFDRDLEAVQRIWIECGWIDDDKDERAAVADFLRAGETEIATINDTAECSVHWTPGTIRYQDETLNLGAVTAVTTSHIGRKQRFAQRLTARSLARQRAAGMQVSALGIFDQGFYNRLGYGNGPYETSVQFDPSTLKIDTPYRTPRRLTLDDCSAIHEALHNRRMYHGGVCLGPEKITEAELKFHEKPYGLGYFDGPDGSLSHFIWGEMKGEHGPYRITLRAYQTREQLFELLALIKSLGDQISSFRTLEFGEFQLHDLLEQPFRNDRIRAGSEHTMRSRALAYWQLRILDLGACVARTRLPGSPLRFNLELNDPVDELLTGDLNWQPIGGSYLITLGETSSAASGRDAALPTLTASINAFTRLWFGIQSATGLAIGDELVASDELIEALDRKIALPRPHLGWDF